METRTVRTLVMTQDNAITTVMTKTSPAAKGIPQVTKWEDVALCEGISDGATNFVHQRMSIYLYTFHRNVYTLVTRCSCWWWCVS